MRIKLAHKAVRNEMVMNEGIDIIGKKVAYDPWHKQYVDTRELSMLPIEREISIRVLNTDKATTYPVISIFGRNTNDNGTRRDGNPLIYALKGENGWSFRSENDKKHILAQALNVAKNLFSHHHIDTIVFAPSTNRLNTLLKSIVEEACPMATMLPNTAIRKKKKSYVFGGLDYDWIRYILSHYDPSVRGWKKDDPRWNEYIAEQDEQLQQYFNDMGDVFTYHHLSMPFRKAIPQSAEIGDMCEYDVMLNDKDIAIIDDTLTTGKTLSDISELILKTYVPKSITFITMFSSLNATDLNTEVSTANWKDNLKVVKK